MVMRFPGSFADARGREGISIVADGRTLRLTIRGVEFTGLDFDDLEPAPGGAGTSEFDLASGALTGYTLDWQMPVQVASPGGDCTATLHCHLELHHPATENLTLSLGLNSAVQVTTASRIVTLTTPSLTSSGNSRRAPISKRASAARTPPSSPVAARCQADWPASATTSRLPRRHCKRELFQIWKTKTELVRETHLCPQYERRGPREAPAADFPRP